MKFAFRIFAAVLILFVACSLWSEFTHIRRNCIKIYDGESTTIRGVKYPHYVWACPDGQP